MDSLIRMIDALAWPVTAIVIVLMLRRHIGSLLSRLTHLRYRDAEADFETGLRKAESLAQEPLPDEAWEGEPRLSPKTYSEVQKELERLAEISARAAIVEAWRYVELAARATADVLGIKGRGAPTSEVVRELVKMQVFHGEAPDLVEELRLLRNQAAHSEYFDVPADAARRYIDLALQYAANIENASGILPLLAESGACEPHPGQGQQTR